MLTSPDELRNLQVDNFWLMKSVPSIAGVGAFGAGASIFGSDEAMAAGTGDATNTREAEKKFLLT